MGAPFAIGPRNRRRLRFGAVAAGLIGIVAAVILITHPGSGGSAAPARAAHHGVPTASSRATHLVYGMTPQQVQHLAGRAERVRGACWFYTPVRASSGTRVGALNVGIPQTPSMTSDQIKLCFYAGVLSFEYSHDLTPEGRRWIETQF